MNIVNNKMSHKVNNEYALCAKKVEIKLIVQKFIPDDNHHHHQQQQQQQQQAPTLILQPGMMVQIKDRCSNKYCSIKVYDFHCKNILWENNLFLCPPSNLLIVSSDIWLFLAAIVDPQDRLEFYKNEILVRYVQQLRKDDIVSASGMAFRLEGNFDCIVRYIGEVPEFGPGYYFGLEILQLNLGHSPQAYDLTYIDKYMECGPNLALIVPANVLKLPPDQKSAHKKPNFVNQLLCVTVDRVDRALGDFGNRHSNLRHSKRAKSDESKRLSLNSDAPEFRDQEGFSSSKSVNGLNDVDMMDSSKSNKNIASSGSHSNLRRDDNIPGVGRYVEKLDIYIDDDDKTLLSKSSQTNGNKSTHINNEEYSKYLEAHERNLEKIHQESDYRHHEKPPSGKAVKKKAPAVISSVKPNTIMSLEDRDIVVIDKADIKESVKNESEVIVLDNPRTQSGDVDLVDILGQNWPALAGDTALVLNNEKRGTMTSSSSSSNSSYQMKSERNRSGNPISHFMSTKSNSERKNRENIIKINEESTSSSFDSNSSVTTKKKSGEPYYDNLNSSVQLISISPAEDEYIAPSQLLEIPGTNLGVGSMVEVSTDVSEDLYGVIRWIGFTQASNSKSIMVGVELEEDQDERPLTLTDGSYNGSRLFRCPPGRALFVHPSQCSKDRRFLEIDRGSASVGTSVATISKSPSAASSSGTVKSTDTAKMFGQVECPIVPGSISPLKILKADDLEAICGKFKGIQGHHNSCYLDATLFAMFTFTSVFDSLLFRPPEPEDSPHYEEVQKVLREEIVNPLRKNCFVRADRVMKLRQLLDKLSSVKGLTSEEKDPEEFLNCLLAQIMRAEPFLKLSSGQDAFYYQLFVEKDERLSLPSVQQLFEQSFLASDIKLKEVPSCLIIQMPRFGKNFKMYPRILPSQVLDVTDIIEDSPRICTVCGKLAEFECKECFGIMQCVVGLESTAFCKKCLDIAHSHVKRTNHTPREISVPQDFKIMAEHCPVPRLFMELFAVVCIETSHYVAFVKSGPGQDAPWCFFDSMADRKGEQNGYNIPEMVSVSDLPQWLSEDGAHILNETASHDKMLPEHAKRLLCDAYMCMYQSTDVMMYR